MPVLQQIISNNQSHCVWHSPHCIKRVTYIFFSSDGISVFTIIDWKWEQIHLNLSGTGLEHTPVVNLREYPPGRSVLPPLTLIPYNSEDQPQGLYFSKTLFAGLIFRGGLYSEGLMYGGKFAFKNRLGYSL